MNNRGKVRYVFTSSNTNQGFYTFIPDLISDLQQVYILKGAAGSGKSTFIRLLGEAIAEQGFEVEFWISATDAVTPDGVFIPQLKAAVVNGSLPQPIDPQYPGFRETIINLGEYWQKDVVKYRNSDIDDLVEKYHKHSNQACSTLKQAALVKEEIKKVISSHLNMERMDKLVNNLSVEILENNSGEKHYFASAVTADGVVSYVDEISRDCQKRYIFNGPSGSGKSTIINEIAQKAKHKGYLLEYYHCGFDVESIAMVIIRNLQVALIDTCDNQITVRPWDIIINMADYLDKYNSDLINTLTSQNYRRLETLMIQVQAELEQAENILKELKKIYSSAMDFGLLDKKRNEIQKKISNQE